MTIKCLFLLILSLSFINICFMYTQWFKKVFLFSNILVFWTTLFFWIFYNKLIINLQFVYVLPLKILNFEWLLVFGVNSISMFFLILTTFLICICLFLNYEKLYKIREFNFLIWILQFILIIFFTTSDLIIFFICFELTLVPIFFIIIIWGSSVRRIVAAYYFFLYTSLGAVFMIIGISLIIFECGTTNFIILESYKFNFYKQAILFFFFFEDLL